MGELSQLDRLLAIEDIIVLRARLDRALDTKEWAHYERLHAPACQICADGRERQRGAAEIAAHAKASLADARSAHHSHTPQIAFEGAFAAAAVWGVEKHIFWKQGDDDHWLQAFGFLHETYEKRDGQWLITRSDLQRSHLRTSPGASEERISLLSWGPHA